MGHVMNTAKENMQVGSDKNKLILGRIRQEQVENNMINFNYLNIPVISLFCIDSRCSTHCSSDRVMITGKLPIIHSICVGQPYATNMKYTHNTYLPLPQLYLFARHVHILPAMKDHCLIPVRKICDDGFAVKFNTKNIFLQNFNDVLIVYRYVTIGLYLIDFDKPQPLTSISNHNFLPPSVPSSSPSKTLANFVH